VSHFTIDELTVPATLDDAHDFITSVEVGNEVEALAYEPEEELAIFHNPHEPKRLLVARVDGRIVARGMHETTTGDDADTSWLTNEVLPEYRGHGIGTAIAERLEGIASEEGKTKVVVYAAIAEGPGARLDSPTGFGSIVADRDEVRFLQARGYRFEQVERLSRLSLPVADLAGRVAAAERRSGADYRLRSFIAPTPEPYLDDMAVLITRMSTDAPSAGLEEPEDVWTAERIVESDDRSARMSPRRRFTSVIEHIPSGRLVGFTTLSVPVQSHRAVDQYATLVLREHRGHALGMLLKVGNLAHLEKQKPGHPSVMTFNAEENRHMLDVNEAVGFVPVANESAWRKDLS